MRKLEIPILHRYLLKSFFTAFLGCLFAFVTLFIVFDFFERLRTFIKEDSTFLQALTYVLLKVPLIVQLMTPVAVLVATLIAIGKLSQLSEITAMRASGASILWLIRPLACAGLLISFLQFVGGETIVPWATEEVERIYNIDIKKKVEKGRLSRENFWYRKAGTFYSIDLYDSKKASLEGISKFEFDNGFRLRKRTDADVAEWNSPKVGWLMKGITEIEFDREGKLQLETFKKLPLVIDERPTDFYNMQREPEEMTSKELRKYIVKLKSEGAPVSSYLVQLASKYSFPLVNVVAILLAIPFALRTSRSGKMTLSLILGIGIGFAYHFVHAVCSALGGAELIPVAAAAWGANILFGSLALYILGGAEISK